MRLISGYNGNFYYAKGSELFYEGKLIRTFGSQIKDLLVDEGVLWVLLENKALVRDGRLYKRAVKSFDVCKGLLAYTNLNNQLRIGSEEYCEPIHFSVGCDGVVYCSTLDNLIKIYKDKEPVYEEPVLTYWSLCDGSELFFSDRFYHNGVEVPGDYKGLYISSESWLIWDDKGCYTGSVDGCVGFPVEHLAYSKGNLGWLDQQGNYEKITAL